MSTSTPSPMSTSSEPTLPSSIVVKCKWNDDVRRIKVEAPFNLTQLTQLLLTTYSLSSSSSSFVLKYNDEDGDLLTLSTNDELKQLIAAVDHNNNNKQLLPTVKLVLLQSATTATSIVPAPTIIHQAVSTSPSSSSSSSSSSSASSGERDEREERKQHRLMEKAKRAAFRFWKRNMCSSITAATGTVCSVCQQQICDPIYFRCLMCSPLDKEGCPTNATDVSTTDTAKNNVGVFVCHACFHRGADEHSKNHALVKFKMGHPHHGHHDHPHRHHGPHHHHRHGDEESVHHHHPHHHSHERGHGHHHGHGHGALHHGHHGHHHNAIAENTTSSSNADNATQMSQNEASRTIDVVDPRSFCHFRHGRRRHHGDNGNASKHKKGCFRKRVCDENSSGTNSSSSSSSSESSTSESEKEDHQLSRLLDQQARLDLHHACAVSKLEWRRAKLLAGQEKQQAKQAKRDAKLAAKAAAKAANAEKKVAAATD